MYLVFLILYFGRSPHGVVTNELDSDIVVREFIPQLCY